MNRQQRRAQKHAKPRKENRSAKTYFTGFQLEFESFDTVERFFMHMRNGSLEWEDGEGWVILGLSGEYLHILSALEGWITYWHELCLGEDISYDDSALRRLAKSLEYEKPLNMAEINAAYAVVGLQRQLYRALPKQVTTRYAHTVRAQIKRDDEIKDLIKAAL
jgi:hypothetical protein